MKVIQIMDDFCVGGGVNSFVYDLCHALKKQGCDVSLIGILNKGYDQNDEIEKLKREEIRVECIGATSKKDAVIHCIKKLREVIKDVSDEELTVCNLHLKLSVLMGVIATYGLRQVKCVETYHSLYSRYWLQNKVLSPFIEKYIPCSKTAEREFVERFHPDIKKVEMIPNGVDGEKLRQDVKSIKKNSIVSAISVGRFTNQKNLHVTAKAFSRIEEPDFQYKIFGDGPEKSRIIENAGEKNNIVLYGIVPRQRIINELGNASIVVMPSLWEGLSIFMLEALALGCPMMIADVPSLRDVFGEEKLKDDEIWRKCEWGYLVETSNVKAYEQAMRDFLTSLDKRGQMVSSVKKVANQYDIRSTANHYKKVYEGIGR